MINSIDIVNINTSTLVVQITIINGDIIMYDNCTDFIHFTNNTNTNTNNNNNTTSLDLNKYKRSCRNNQESTAW